MSGIIDHEQEQRDKSMISLTTCSAPLLCHISQSIDETRLLFKDLDVENENRRHRSVFHDNLLCFDSMGKSQTESQTESENFNDENDENNENDEHCIEFKFNEIEDFYLQNAASPEFTKEDSNFTFANIANINDDEKASALDLELFDIANVLQEIGTDTNTDTNTNTNTDTNIVSYTNTTNTNSNTSSNTNSNSTTSDKEKIIPSEITPTPSCDTPTDILTNSDLINIHPCITTYNQMNRFQNIRNIQNIENIENFQNIQSIQDIENIKTIQNIQQIIKSTNNMNNGIINNNSGNSGGNNNINNNIKVKRNFLTMEVKYILDLQLSIFELVENNLIHRLMKDQIGSRHLQYLIKTEGGNSTKNKKNSGGKGNIISLLINNLICNNINLTEMSEDIYGNYLIQLFFIYGQDMHYEVLFNYFVYKSVLNLSKSKYGCRVIQKILCTVSDNKQLIKLIECFSNQIVETSSSLKECLLCCNTNHVIQSMIELKLPFTNVAFIATELENNLVLYSENVYACRVVQSFIKNYGDKINVNKLFENNNHLFLSQVKYGNYVIQCIIEKNKWYSNLSLINKFRNRLINDVFNKKNVLYLCKDKHGSNVIETAIKCSNEKQLHLLINTICLKKGFLLKQILSDKFGNYIPKTLLEYANKKQQKILVNTTHKFITNLYNKYHTHRQCAKFIQICQEFKYKMDRINDL